MKITVTGATGFLGRHVLKLLMSHGMEVAVVTRHPGKLASLAGKYEAIELDINHAGEDAYEKIGSPDVLIHLAWDGLPNYKSLHHFETVLPAHYRFLKRCVMGGLGSLVVSGTCSEYGLKSGELKENAVADPGNSYGFAKDALRRALQFLGTAHPFKLSWLRLFYMYGEGQSKDSLIPQLEEALRRKDTVFNMSGGEQIRDFLPVTEVARYIVDIALKLQDCGIVNVCSGKAVSVKKFVEQYLVEMNASITLNLGHYPYPDYEPMSFWGNRDKLDAILKS